MCTALNLPGQSHYFGRNLDLDRSYGEKVCILPRRFLLNFCQMGENREHYAIMGMAVVTQGVALFYDGMNERGLCMAGLNFPGNAYYHPKQQGKDNVAPFEFIPWVLSQCDSVEGAKTLLSRLNLVDIPFSGQIPLAPLHWMISDAKASIVVESVKEGLRVYDDPAQVLTNNPPFPYQLFQLNNLRGLSPATPPNRFSDRLELEVYAQGLGGLGLPGDLSSMSRFQRMAFHALNSVSEGDGVGQFFHLLGSVKMVRGVCRTDAGAWDITVYSCCMDADHGRYYYTTYGNRQISCVDMHREALDGEKLLSFELRKQEQIYYQN